MVRLTAKASKDKEELGTVVFKNILVHSSADEMKRRKEKHRSFY